ncbi:hypothetical protein ACFOLK_09375 [Marinococcus halophilus]|uniref:Uncharacterized protein n=1 Tax=Marinococcus halophilus TaxID=1371 RepID=A0A510Y4G9_MARHA|nr:hypothetical protein [Marinococcus halophilus]GEK58222.1 hypothetical protein MHA01_11270 [Marinococcus halophilus]
MNTAWKTGILAGSLTIIILFFLDVLLPDLPALLQVSSNAVVSFLAMATAYAVFSKKNS